MVDGSSYLIQRGRERFGGKGGVLVLQNYLPTYPILFRPPPESFLPGFSLRHLREKTDTWAGGGWLVQEKRSDAPSDMTNLFRFRFGLYLMYFGLVMECFSFPILYT